MRYLNFVPLIIAISVGTLSTSIVSAQQQSQTKKDDTNVFFENGNNFFRGCESQGMLRQSSVSYLVGLVDGIKLSKHYDSKLDICLSDGVTGTQMLDVVCKDMRLYPNLRNAPAAYIAMSALQDAFPCNKGK